MKTKHQIVVILFLTFVICGCSTLNFVNYYTQSETATWKVLSYEEDNVYAYEYNCDSFSLRLETLDRGFWALLGPPFIPIIPVGRIFYPDTSIVSFYIKISTTDSIANCLPEIAISTDTGKTWISPSIADTLPERMYIQKWGDLQSPKSPFPNGHDRTGKYTFVIPSFPPETIQIKFLKLYYGCNIPTINYVQASDIQYRPFVMPRSH